MKEDIEYLGKYTLSDEEEKSMVCSFCGKKIGEVKILIDGNDKGSKVHICENCVKEFYEILEVEHLV